MKAEEWSSVKLKVKLSEKHVNTTIIRLEPWLEPREKKQRVLFSYDDDERISLTVIASLDKFTLPVLGSSWFQTNLIDSGILEGRSGQSLYQRWKSKLQVIVSDAITCIKRSGVPTKEHLETYVQEQLKELHGLVEVIQVELTPVILEF